MNYAVRRGLRPRTIEEENTTKGDDGTFALFEVVTSERERERKREIKVGTPIRGPEPLYPSLPPPRFPLWIFHLNFYITTLLQLRRRRLLDSRYADTLAEPIEIFIPTRLPF